MASSPGRRGRYRLKRNTPRSEVGVGRLQFRLETFNLFNRANFGTPEMIAFIDGQPNPTAGRITTTRTPARQMQLGLRWVF